MRVYLLLSLFISLQVFPCDDGAEAIARVWQKYADRPQNPTRPGLGDLSDVEVSSIQKFASETEVPIVVVGSATVGKRRGLGQLGEVGHKPGTRSDIDYIIPSTQKEVEDFFQAGLRSYDDLPQSQLPSYDRFQGLGFTTPDEDSFRIWFQAGQEPVYLRPGEANLPMFKVDVPSPAPVKKNLYPDLKFSEKDVMGQQFWIADGYRQTGRAGYIRFDVHESTRGFKYDAGYDLDEPHVYIEMVRGDPNKPGLGSWLLDRVTERYPNHSFVSELAIKNESALRQALKAAKDGGVSLSNASELEKLFASIPAVKGARGPYRIIPKFSDDGNVDSFLIIRRPSSEGVPRFEGFGEYADDPRLQKWMEGLDTRPPEFFETQEIKNRIK